MSKCCHNAVTMSTPSVRFLFVRFSRAPATVVAVAANQLVAHPSLVSGHRIRERHDNVTKTSRASDRSGTRPRCFLCGRCDVTSQGAGTIRRIAAMVDLVEELHLERDHGRSRDGEGIRPIERCIRRLRAEGQSVGEVASRIRRSGDYVRRVESYTQLKQASRGGSSGQGIGN